MQAIIDDYKVQLISENGEIPVTIQWNKQSTQTIYIHEISVIKLQPSCFSYVGTDVGTVRICNKVYSTIIYSNNYSGNLRRLVPRKRKSYNLVRYIV